jgi:DNA primase large subunit
MIGEGIGIPELLKLFRAIQDKDLHLDVKILDEGWVPITQDSLKAMIQSVIGGKIQGGADIRLRLHAVETIPRHNSPKP